MSLNSHPCNNYLSEMFGGNMANNFGGQQQQPAGGGLFNAGKPATGNGLFGNQPQQQQGAGLFGGNQGGAFGQQPQQNTGFMQPTQPQQGLFGNQPAGGGIFGSNPPQQGQGMFGGGQQQQQPQQGAFGQQQPQQGGGLFGGQQQPQQPAGMGLFGGQQQQPQGAGVFGQPQQPQQGAGLFGGQQQQPQQGAGLFGQTQQQPQQAGGLFGGATQAPGAGLFGAATNNANPSFLGQQPQQQQQQNPFGANPSPSPFGGTSMFGQQQQQQQQQPGSIFGGQQPQQQQQQPNAGGLFNTFAPGTQQQQQGQTGMFQQAPSATGSTSIFGNTAFNNPAGGTSWGVPTNLNATPSVNSVSVGTQVQAVKSKNSKLDAKHLVKCIAALDQFNGLSKEEIRISYIQSGGQQPTITQQQQAPTAFGNTAFKPLGTGLGAQTSLPSFGGLASNNTIPTQGTSLFGQQQQASVGQGAFGQAKPAFGQATTGPAFGQQGTSLFGQQQPQQQQQGTSLFGGATQQQPATSLFGQPAATTAPSLFGQQQTPAFGQTQAQPATSLFGGAAQQQPTSLFGQPAQQTTSLFGQQPAQQTTSMFGQQAQQPATSLFGQPAQQQTAPSLFGAQPASTSLFGQTTPAMGTAMGQAPSMFGQMQPATATPAQTGFFNQPAAFSQLANPLFQGQQQPIDPNLQMLLPQLLLSYALTQPQQAGSDPATNPALDLLGKLTSLVNQLSVNQNQSGATMQATPSTPFDEFMKEAKNDRLVMQKKESQNAYSLFSEFEKEPNYYLESAAFPVYDHKRKEEPQFTVNSVHKVPKKQESLLSSGSLKQASRSYRASQEEGRSKISSVLNDLPKVGNFSISPSLERLKTYSSKQLREVEHLRIWNQFGEVEFLEPISVYRADLGSSVTISKDNIEITDPELQDKRMRMTFRNFGNYANLKGEEREKVLKRMRKWIAKYEMREVKHDESTGDLVVEVDN